MEKEPLKCDRCQQISQNVTLWKGDSLCPECRVSENDGVVVGIVVVIFIVVVIGILVSVFFGW